MPIDIKTIEHLKLPPIASTYSVDDVIYYALSVGVGTEKVGSEETKYLYETDLKIVPTFFTTVGYPGPIFRDNDLGVDGSRIVHLEQYIRVPGNVPTSANYVAKNFISAIWDQGEGKAALVEVSRTISLVGATTPTVAMKQINYCPDGGGFGGERAPKPVPLVPDGDVGKVSMELAIPESAAFLYRLNGDRNPLHVDPEYARSRGFAQPILHGLYLYGLIAQHFSRARGHEKRDRDFCMFARFCAPAFAGQKYILSWSDTPAGHIGRLIGQAGPKTVVEFSIGSTFGGPVRC